jgi:GNAT superfamily N-acetyltransferase
MFKFIESDDADLALQYSLEDPDTPFPEIWNRAALNQCLLIIRKGQEDIGWALCVTLLNDLHLHKFFIRPDFRGRGISVVAAESLVRHLLGHGLSFCIAVIDDRSEKFWSKALSAIPHKRYNEDTFFVAEYHEL